MIVHGKDVVLTVDAGNGFSPICCGRTASLTTSTDIAETSTLGTGTWKTYKGMRNSFTISAGGLVSYDMNVSISTMRSLQANFTIVNFQFTGIDRKGNVEKYTGSFIITSIGTPTSYNGNFEYSVEGKGTGALTIETLFDTDFVIDAGTERILYE